jgi:hypothetical protein
MILQQLREQSEWDRTTLETIFGKKIGT